MSASEDQRALQASQAGLRLIVMLTLYDDRHYDRLRTLVREYYTAAALDEQPAVVSWRSSRCWPPSRAGCACAR
jgi:hypothetical protein